MEEKLLFYGIICSDVFEFTHWIKSNKDKIENSALIPIYSQYDIPFNLIHEFVIDSKTATKELWSIYERARFKTICKTCDSPMSEKYKMGDYHPVCTNCK